MGTTDNTKYQLGKTLTPIDNPRYNQKSNPQLYTTAHQMSIREYPNLGFTLSTTK